MGNSQNNDPFEGQNRLLMAREEAKFEKAKEKAEALQRNAARALAKAVKESSRMLAKQAADAVQRGDTGALSPTERALLNAALAGRSEVAGINEGKITGFDERERFGLGANSEEEALDSE